MLAGVVSAQRAFVPVDLDLDLWLLTSTFKLVRAKDQTRLPMNRCTKKRETCDKSRVLLDHPRYRSATWICTCGHTPVVVIYSKFHRRNPFRSFGIWIHEWVEIRPLPLPWLFVFYSLYTAVQAVINVAYYNTDDQWQTADTFWILDISIGYHVSVLWVVVFVALDAGDWLRIAATRTILSLPKNRDSCGLPFTTVITVIECATQINCSKSGNRLHSLTIYQLSL